jgi:hypothetical protein
LKLLIASRSDRSIPWATRHQPSLFPGWSVRHLHSTWSFPTRKKRASTPPFLNHPHPATAAFPTSRHTSRVPRIHDRDLTINYSLPFLTHWCRNSVDARAERWAIPLRTELPAACELQTFLPRLEFIPKDYPRRANTLAAVIVSHSGFDRAAGGSHRTRICAVFSYWHGVERSAFAIGHNVGTNIFLRASCERRRAYSFINRSGLAESSCNTT